jgi:hypothetical protein
MKNGKLPGYNRIGKRESPGTFPGVPLKRLRQLSIFMTVLSLYLEMLKSIP